MKRFNNFSFWVLPLFLFFSCVFNPNKNSCHETVDNKSVWRECKESKDPFIILEYINRNPDSEYFVEALKVFSKEISILRKESQPPPPDLSCVGNCIEVLIDIENEIILFGDSVKIENLKKTALGFLLNENENAELPKYESVVDSYGNKIKISKGYFLLSADTDSLEFIQNVAIELRKSIQEYMNQKSLEIYHENFNRLEDEKRIYINSLFNDRIRFFYIKGHLEI